MRKLGGSSPPADIFWLYSPVVRTPDFESGSPSSNLGRAIFSLRKLRMAERAPAIPARELARMQASFDKSQQLITTIYTNIAEYRVHGLARYYDKAFDAKDELVRELDDFMPLRMDVSLFTPHQKVRRTRRNRR